MVRAVGVPTRDGNLLKNGSFEASPGFAQSVQGEMPPGWERTQVTPDLYSSDRSFGLQSSISGIFDGLGWVAAWSDADEVFAQRLTSPLTLGAEYTLDAYLLQASRDDLDSPGDYDIVLNSSNTLMHAEELAAFDPNTDFDQWEFRSTTFTAPSNSDALPWLFRPYTMSPPKSSYPGIDALSLVPEPAGFTLLGLSMLYLRQSIGPRGRNAV